MNYSVTYNHIEDDIRDSVKKYIPNLDIKHITITNGESDTEETSVEDQENERLFRTSDSSTKPYTAKVKIEYDINSNTFSSSDFIIINI